MAPGFDQLSDHDYDDDIEDIDFSDLKERYDVRMEEGLDTFVVVDGLPVVTEEQKSKLIKFLLKRLNSVGRIKDGEESIFMPMNDQGNSEGFAFVEYQTPEQAVAATKQLHGVALDKKHTLAVNKLTDIEKYGREGRIDEEYTQPEIEPFSDREHLRWWLFDPAARDQFAMFRGDNVGVYWHNKKEPPEPIVDRKHWTQLFVSWSPHGTYLASIHQQGVQLWGGESFKRIKQFPHPFVSLVEFSPGENYITTWSHQPIVVEEGKGPLTLDEEGKHIIIWDITTGKPLRSFVAYDLPAPPNADPGAIPPKAKVQWPAFKWSADEKFVARMKPNESISVYELPRMNLLDKTSIKVEGIVEFEFAPAITQREGVKTYESLVCFWTPEMGSNPAKVTLMSLPSKEVVRTRNLFNVTDAKLHWQSDAKFICVKVDRHSKSKKSLATNLEIFRIKEKGVPVEVVDSMKDTVINFAWEPKGDRFVLITAGEAVAGSNVAPKTAVSFFTPEKVKGAGTGAFKHARTFDKKNSNGIYWSPKGRFVVIATVSVQQFSDLDFYDLDYEGEKPESEAHLNANLMLMNSEDHYGMTDVEWDPTGRYVTTSASVWTHQMENGYKIWTFYGQLLQDAPTEKFKQLLWRPRPPTMLPKEEQRTIRRNLREYSKEFEELDKELEEGANAAVIDARRRLYMEWYSWLEQEKELLREEREELGLPDPDAELELQRTKSADVDADKVVEEVVEEVIEETEEIVS
ncbi:Translation initiation factor 3 subunit b [Elasticomyces elasticus]|uniref:Eukaryotic translation initiation factor 3 subunit B n=3 Tax=Exophiala sideris TaxID=1016849 RepID=A0A0D1YUB7_9EURO|nr:Translation initiation factor 3 subunit b [Elasticomyces elasticus]KAK5026183.1 Translation initiation factor 3 subunit b [Exophiala sideris]KAK5178124.1 Translation initiation factor 3 subunit b [Eurotiomycetes sp. CCFEE 6388]KAK5032437.1 Translation initiation factor 3 subunit b [Exophiala sideris]KAK5059593.1 Translation initiation factor 3 subunit b [Exophiala sideris]